MKLKIITLSFIVIFILVASIYISKHTARENFTYSIQNISQNALIFVNSETQNKLLISNSAQKKLAQNYLQQYFSPWKHHNADYFLKLKELKNLIKHTIENYKNNPGYGINHLPNSKDWIKAISDNINLNNFPNAYHKAITIRNTNIRDLPTYQPSFGNFNQAGQGYPFDNLEVSSLPANIPALIIQKTRDGAWCYIITHNDEGWVPASTLAIVNQPFIHQWETKKYIVLIKNKIPIIDHQNNTLFRADIGQIFPETRHGFILIAVANSNQRAVIKLGRININSAVTFPLQATQKNIATIMNAMLGVKYGWGGMTRDSDCSLTVMNLFSTFGIWLPRASTLQADTGQIINLKNLTHAQKSKLIIAQGIPFLTLLHMPGHIVVYIGEKAGRIYIFQTVWGLHTDNFFGQKGRAIIGSTVIAPADLGVDDINVKKTWLDRMDRMIFN